MEMTALVPAVGGTVTYDEEDVKKLRHYLTIKSPNQNVTNEGNIQANAPIALEFTRSRPVPIDWPSIIPSFLATKIAIVQFRKKLESVWGMTQFDAGVVEKHAKTITSDNEVIYSKIESENGQLRLGGRVPKGTVLLHEGERQKFYWLQGENLKFLSLNKDEYEGSWDRVVQINAVTDALEIRNSPFSEASEIDLVPEAILRQYSEINASSSFAIALDQKADALPDKIDVTQMEAAEIDLLLSKYRDFKLRLPALKLKLEKLKQLAEKHKYYLCISDEAKPIPGPGQQVKHLKAGRLYAEKRDVCHWTSPIRNDVWLGPVRMPVTTNQEHSQEFLNYTEVSLDLDPVETERAHLQKDGYSVHIFSRTEDSYIDENGIKLQALMDRLELDEASRKRTAILIPVFEESLSYGQYISKFMVIKRPWPGLTVTLPRVFMQEGLTYKLTWRGTELGRLAASVNLAPGESRQIAISRSNQSEVTSTSSYATTSEVLQNQSSDLASEIESEAKAESNRTNNTNWNVEARGSYGPFSASGAGGGSSTMTASQFSRHLNKLARRAASTLSQKTKTDISSTTSVKTSSQYSNTAAATVKNINEGRSLNLEFYEINNIHVSSLHLDSYKFFALFGEELVAGTGIMKYGSYGQASIGELVADIISGVVFGSLKPEESLNLQIGIEKAIRDFITSEYSKVDEAVAKGDRAPVPASRGTIRFRNPPPADLDRAGATNDSVRAQLTTTAAWLSSGEVQDDVIGSVTQLSLASGGFHLEAAVGLVPATEPYSERMREQEVHRRSAEIVLKEAEARLLDARANYLVARGNRLKPILGLAVGEGNQSITVMLRDPLPPGRWVLYADNVTRAQFEASNIGRRELSHSWTTPQAWLTGLPVVRVSLFDEDRGLSIRNASPD
jgi:hypothetical protein